MVDNKVLITVWLVLLLFTLISVLMAEQVDFTALSAVLVCAIVVIKSHLVIDYLIGLKLVHPRLRKVMLGYFYLIPSLIALGAVRPDWIVSMTSLN
tara:strand:+ start:22952 stop:23239 length:288 start_codon:yes stop_codon:yes gene_type:complete